MSSTVYTLENFKSYVEGKIGSFADGKYTKDRLYWIISDIEDQVNSYGLSGDEVNALIDSAEAEMLAMWENDEDYTAEG